MPNHLNPSETYPINRILKDWADSTTYYVQAKIYDAQTRTLLATKNLVDHGNRWFSVDYKVPHDNVFSNGTRIIIVTSVYTDANYTVRSDNHVDEPEEYLIQLRWNPTVNFGGGDGGWDHKAIIKEVTLLFDEEMQKLKKDLKVGEPVADIDMDAVLSKAMQTVLEEVRTVGQKVDSIEKPQKPETVDLTPIMAVLRGLAAKIDGLPQPEKVNLAPILIEVGRQLNLLKEHLVDEISKQTSKELTLSFNDSPDAVTKKNRDALLTGIKSRYVKKQ